MLKFLKNNTKNKTKKNKLYAPANGEYIALNKIEDPVFSSKMMGDGFAINPSDDEIYSPVDGKITMIANTKHAIGFLVNNNIEVLVHLGIDTVSMTSNPFKIFLSVGDRVEAGQKIGEMNVNQITSSGFDSKIMVIVTSMQEVNILTDNHSQNYIYGDPIAEISDKKIVTH